MGSEQRTPAKALAACVVKGESMAAIAEALIVSSATARRFLTNLDLSRKVEAGEFDAIWRPGDKQVVVHTVTAKA